MTGWELRIWRKSMLWSREKAAREFGVTQRTWHARENAEQVDVTVWRTTRALSVRDLLPHMQGMRKADIIRRLENELGGNGRGCVSVVHSPAECQATAHQETVFSVLHRKVPWPPESVPASSPYPEAGRLFPAPLQEHLFQNLSV